MYRPTLLGFARTTFPLSGASRSVLVATEGRYVLVPERIEWTNHGIQFSLFGICMDTCMYSYIYIYIFLWMNIPSQEVLGYHSEGCISTFSTLPRECSDA